MKRERIVLGITGTNGAGKGTIVEYLVNTKDYGHLSASGLIRQEILRRKMPVDRDSMIKIGNDLRSKFGAAHIIEELIKEAQSQNGNMIIESIRTLGEVEKLKETGGVLLAVDADQKIRYERIVKRGGDKDRVSFEEFVKQEGEEMESNDPNKQNLLVCKRKADYLIENSGSREELKGQIEKLLVKIIKNGE